MSYSRKNPGLLCHRSRLIPNNPAAFGSTPESGKVESLFALLYAHVRRVDTP